jgi:cell division protein FtsL
MVRLNVILLGIAIICALSVVTSQHNARKRYTVLQEEQKLAHELDVEWGRLQLEQSTWAMHSRIEVEATRQLMMVVPSNDRVQMIVPQREDSVR